MARKLCLTVVGLALAAGTAVTTPAETRTVHTEYVRFSDLYLREKEAQKVLKDRVFASANRICFNGNAGLAQWECARATFRKAQPQIESVINRAIAGRPHAEATLALWGRPARPGS